MLNRIKRFRLDESDLEAVEWAIIGGVIAVVAVGLLFAIGQDVFSGMISLGVETAMIPLVE